MGKQRRQTLASVTMQRAGMREGVKVMNVMMQWWLVHHEIGHAPTVEEYADWWGLSLAQAYRHRVLFRECWPEVSDPSGMAAVLGLDLVEGEVKHAAAVPVTDALLQQ